MFTVPEQFTTAARANFDAQIAAMTAFTQKAFANAEKIVELNRMAARDAFAESSAATRQLLAAKGPQEFFTLTTARPGTDKIVAYGRELAGIAAAAQADFSREAELQLAETRRKIASLLEDLTKNAPAGTESVVALFKTAIGHANAGFDQFGKTAKQAVDAIEANVAGTASTLSQAPEKTTGRATKK